MNPELLKRWESLTSAAAGDARAAARWGKLRRMLGVASASLLFAFVALTLVNAAAGLTVALLVLGVATGITMEFEFGTNWAYYSHYVGDIFGAPLASTQRGRAAVWEISRAAEEILARAGCQCRVFSFVQ